MVARSGVLYDTTSTLGSGSSGSLGRRPAFVFAAIFLTGFLLGCPDRSVSDARALATAGEFAKAGELFRNTAERDPANLAAWDGAIDMWCRKQIDVGRCLDVLDRELALLGSVERHANALSEVLERRARERIASGLASAALDDLARAERAAPKRASVFVARSRALVMLGRAREALDALYTARVLDPHDEEANAMFREIPTTTSSEPRFGER